MVFTTNIAADYNDQFEVKDVDKDGKKFDRVSRILASSQTGNMEMTLDVNSELYPIEIGEMYAVRLTSSIERELAGGTRRRDPAAAAQPWRDGAKGTLADEYEYVMYGKIYKHDELKADQDTISSLYVSFGGLILNLHGDYRSLQDFAVGSNPKMAELSHAKTMEIVQATLSHWSKSYMDVASSIPEWKYYTQAPHTNRANHTEVLAVWSKPAKTGPICRAFARVWFEHRIEPTPVLSYRFESQSLIHKILLPAPDRIDASCIDMAAMHLGNPAKCIPQIIASKERVAQHIHDGKLLRDLKRRPTPSADDILADMLRQAQPSAAVVDTTMGGSGKVPFERIFYRDGNVAKPTCGPYGEMVVPKRVEPECWKTLSNSLQSSSGPAVGAADGGAWAAHDGECVAASKIQQAWRLRRGRVNHDENVQDETDGNDHDSGGHQEPEDNVDADNDNSAFGENTLG
ncbi:hypothetical protein SeMB42_g00610 [Synchytrium endobioticum]|uniref:Uncharacterized protein n=1 Tax=Synchytrium endobioticum TaxID=286115 RepID=A0A507DQB6_9FUNG|nr:hypothetical protein SeMB42_g00610 [Synchytrium endobioticum]